MNVLEARNITKRFPGVLALNKVDLTVREGEVHCVVGENGAGKSTLVKVLTGLYRAEEGELLIGDEAVDVHSQHLTKAVAYVPQELDLFPHMTVMENLFIPFRNAEGMKGVFRRAELDRKAQTYIERLNMDVRPGNVVNNIPVSDQQLLQVARALAIEDAKIIILDEPTTSLTKEESRRLFTVIGNLKKEGKSIIFITHKLDEVFAIGDVVSVLRNGELVGHSALGDVDADWIIKKMSGQELDMTKSFRPQTRVGEVILSVNNLSGHRFSNVSFSLKEGEVLGFAGLVGAGRSEIMQTIFGYLPKTGGEISFFGKPWRTGNPAYSIRNGIVYLTEERRSYGIFPYLNVKNNIGVLLPRKVARSGVIQQRKDSLLAKKVVSEYDIKTPSVETLIMNLSGGNQQKVLIGRSMESEPKVLIFDEPTKGIDVKTKAEIYSLMKRLAEEKRVGIILVSSEIEEILRCANRVIAVYQGTVVNDIESNELNTEKLVSSIIGVNR
jgi:ABC-type sugar transport system ATPase subunit